MIKASDLFIKALENEGVEYVFGVPGEENLDFLESLRKSKKIKFILTRHEQGGAFMAATYGRMTGKAGVCLATLGPGATNLVTSGAFANLGAMPMLMITGQKPIKKSKQGKFQIVDIVAMMKTVTKFSKQIITGSSIPALVRESFRIAQEERPGAVHLELPEDVAAENVESHHLFKVHEIRRPDADEFAVKEAAKMILEAKQPLILVGAGANRKRIIHSLENFIKDTCIPYFNTQMGKGAINKHDDFYLGTAALSANDAIHKAIDLSDLIINIGHDVVEKPPFFMDENKNQQVIHINFNSANVDEVYFPQAELIGDISTTLDKLSAKLAKKRDSFGLEKRTKESIDPTMHEIIKIRKDIKEAIHGKDSDDRFPMIPQRIVADVRKSIADDAIVCLDNGMYKIWFARHYHTYYPNTLLLDNALATMGAGLPSAMACALMYPDKQVMAVCGDGGFMMNSQEIETAVRLKLNLVVLILVDNAYGMIKWKQEDAGHTDYGLEYGNPDFVMYAKSFGAKGYKIEKTQDFVQTIQKCFHDGGVNIVEAPIEYSENKILLKSSLQK